MGFAEWMQQPLSGRTSTLAKAVTKLLLKPSLLDSMAEALESRLKRV